MRNFEIVVSLYDRRGKVYARRAIGFAASDMAEARMLAPREARHYGVDSQAFAWQIQKLRDIAED